MYCNGNPRTHDLHNIISAISSYCVSLTKLYSDARETDIDFTSNLDLA